MEQSVLDYQKSLLEKGYRFLYLCDEIDAMDFGERRFYQAVIPGDQPLAPCFNEAPIDIRSEEGLRILQKYLDTNEVDISLVE